MATRRRQRFVHAQTAVMLGAVVFLAAFDLLSLEQFFLVSLVGFLLLVELTAPFSVTPDWRARLKWVVLLGLLGFAYVMGKRVLDLVPSGVL